MLALIPPTLLWPFKFTNPFASASLINFASSSLSPVTKGTFISERSSFLTVPLKSFDESRKIFKVDLKIYDEIVEFYSCHMNLPTCKGEDIDQNLSNLINYTDNKNLKIFMGDFNTDYFHQVDDYKRILDKGLYDTYELAEKKDGGVTVYKNISGWEDSMCQKKLDYVFINRKLDVKESFVIFNDENYPIISDHNGLEVTLAEK